MAARRLLLLSTCLTVMATFGIAQNTSFDSTMIEPADVILNVVNDKIRQPQTSSAGNYQDVAYMHSNERHFSIGPLMNQTLRVIVPAIEPPYVNYVNFTDAAVVDMGYGPGVVIELLKEIGSRLNLTYEIVEADDHAWGDLINGSWTGAFGQLFRGEADILAGGAIMNYDRSAVSDLTYPFQFEATGMLIRSPEKYKDDTLLIVTEPFTWQVWATTAGTVIGSAIIFLGMTTVLGRVYREMSVSLLDSTWVFFSIFVQQGLPEQPRSWSCRILIALWWLASITLSATFTGSLVALFAVEKANLPFQNVEQLVRLVKQGRFTILMDGNSYVRTEMIARSQLPVYIDLWHEMYVNHRVTYVDGIANGITFIGVNSGYVLLGPMSTLSLHAYTDCRLVLLEEGILPVYLSIPLAKNSPYSYYFSTKIREMVERGFTEKWINDYKSYVATKKSNACNQTSTKPKSYLDLKRAQGAFWVLILGIVIGVGFFVVEFVVYFTRRQLEKHNGRKEHTSDTSGSTTHSTHELQEVASYSSPVAATDLPVVVKPTSLRRRNVLNLTLDLSETSERSQ